MKKLKYLRKLKKSQDIKNQTITTHQLLSYKDFNDTVIIDEILFLMLCFLWIKC